MERTVDCRLQALEDVCEAVCLLLRYKHGLPLPVASAAEHDWPPVADAFAPCAPPAEGRSVSDCVEIWTAIEPQLKAMVNGGEAPAKFQVRAWAFASALDVGAFGALGWSAYTRQLLQKTHHGRAVMQLLPGVLCRLHWHYYTMTKLDASNMCPP